MATSHYTIRQGATGTPLGRSFIDDINSMAASYYNVKQHFAAMTQQRDGVTDIDANFVTPAQVYGITTTADVIDSATARALYNEVSSFITNSGPFLEQLCAQVKQ